MTELDSAVERFQRLLLETPSLWRTVDVRTLASGEEGEWVNLLCTACLDRRAESDLRRVEHLPFSPPVACYQKTLPIDQIPNLFSDLQNGEIQFGETKVLFKKRRSDPEGSFERYDWAYVRRATRLDRPVEANLFAIGHTLTAVGGSSDHLSRQVEDGLDGLNNALRRSEFPWDGVDSIARYFLRTNARVSPHTTASFEMFAPLEGRFDPSRCSMWNDQLTCAIVATEPTASRLRLGYFATRDDGHVVQGELPITASLWRERTETWEWTGQFALRDVRRVSLFLSVASSSIDRTEVVDLSAVSTNPRVTSYRLLDPNLTVLQGQLAPGLNAKLLEKVVTRLFWFAGFVVDGYAFEDRLTDGPDAIAFAPNNSFAVVVECTTGPVGGRNGKMGQLVSRTARLRELLGESAPGFILSVLVTSLPMNQIAQADLQDAALDGVSVIVQEDLVELLNLVLEPVTPEAVLVFFRGQVPRVEKRLDIGMEL